MNRLVQVLTGYVAFGEYLRRIRLKMTNTCHHCEEEEGTEQHFLSTFLFLFVHKDVAQLYRAS